MTARFESTRALARRTGCAISLFIKDIGHGLLVVSHNTLALVGLVVLSLLLMFYSQAELRHRVEAEVYDWLETRIGERAGAEGNALFGLDEPDAASRATATDPKALPRQQAAVANWLARRYKVAPEPVSRLVQEAYTLGQRARVEPTLILAIIAVESSFNPFAQSSVGAQGLMQVMTRVHDDKFRAFGGNHATFDPVTNLRVGVQVLKECIRRAGGLEEGLRYYVGAANLSDDGGYVGRVMGEHEMLKAVAAGLPNAPKPRDPAPSVPSTPDDKLALAG